MPDSDGDGIPDYLEVDGGTGTDPRLVDSIGDGFSDGVKYRLKSLGANVTLVLYPDGGGNEGCPSALLHVDSDGDGLWDCDELLLGTNSEAVDTDGDGVPDLIEWLGGTQPAVPDMENDPDSDGLLNAAELRMHTNPAPPTSRISATSPTGTPWRPRPPTTDGGGAPRHRKHQHHLPADDDQRRDRHRSQ